MCGGEQRHGVLVRKPEGKRFLGDLIVDVGMVL
jgi:hypothetical protein